MGSTDTATADEKKNLPTSEVIRQGANLPQEEWNDARLAAARSMLPQGFRDPANMIAFLARAQRSGLDPFSGELHAWEDERGELTFMTSRDGFIKTLRRDPEVEGVEVGAVFENDDFSFTNEGGVITIEHRGTMDRGELKGAYCLIKMEDGADHLEMRLVEDFSHLMGKPNWRNYPIDMLQARCVSAAARLATTAVAGIYTEADYELTEDGRRTSRMVGSRAEEQTTGLAKRLREERDAQAEDGGEPAEEEPSEGAYTEPIEAASRDVTDEEEPTGMPGPEDAEGGLDTGGGESDLEPGTPPGYDVEEEEDGDLASTAEYVCRVCGSEYDSSQALSGHLAGHSKRGEKIPEGWEIQDGEDGFYAIHPDGTVFGESPYDGWQAAVADIQAALTEESEAGKTSSETEPESDESSPHSSGETRSTEEESAERVSREAIREEFEGKSRGQLLVAAYEEVESYSDDTAKEIIHGLVREILGADEDEKVDIMSLDSDQRIELIYRLRSLEAES